ncbi:hypothetical protein P8917_08415 [Bacillus atrophaeus]|uniref:hypothetical protein n=1 Tax=Bacillus atrophaeus TaxID=1452 RepID=UPI00227E5B98|nr:hypothetical protein [Bacillus atrophaeus]MCY8496171.1 hypothetical protein [Bacillus atrophaeus]MCY8814815.1 hypothetical protein [Bacillus atrophaeus]MCY8822490.1 hypothetical protein [Bacillus atrophaeus]MCY8830540.1 hypothetical protein [Bacillus atrophaeus]MCY8834043.1 hypothetical protein [Bacillus atrophaeus]
MIGLIGGGLMVIAGFLVKCFPPRHINSLYNRYSANVMLISGLFVMGAGFMSDTILGPETVINIILQFIYLLIACSLIFFTTQTRLKKLKHGGETDGRH